MVRILFMHPDLGIGGAERLVIDAAMALKAKGHQVSFLTNHYDPEHCFKETKNDSLQIQIVGDWLPLKIFGRFYAFCAYLRMIYAAIYTTFYLRRKEQIDVIFCDQISVCIPILKLFKRRPKIIFYCHFPDQLLSVKGNFLKTLYRLPINYLEEITVGMADTVLVNSKFTLRVFQETFSRLNILPEILYPSINTKIFDEMNNKLQDTGGEVCLPDEVILPQKAFLYLDINRYERKKNHQLAIEAFDQLGKLLSNRDWKQCRLVICGGYDRRVRENVDHYNELLMLVKNFDLENKVMLLRSLSDNEKFMLLAAAQCLLYTPINEHFGIVPLESMYMSVPVIACDSGGPTETVIHNSTGLLCQPNVMAFANAMATIYTDNALRDRMSTMSRKHIQKKFSYEAFGDKLQAVVQNLLKTQSSPKLKTSK